MKIISAEYKGSFVKEEACPQENLPEFAFIGRSNVGKSSLINMLCSRKDLVKVSHAPGKTRTLNFFLINEQLHFVDLPGYGYAKVSLKQREQFEKMIFDYLVKRKQLFCLMVLIDSRLKPQKLDLDFVNSMGEKQIPFAIVFTKSDKQGHTMLSHNRNAFLSRLSESWATMPSVFTTSAVDKTGREQVLEFISKALPGSMI